MIKKNYYTESLKQLEEMDNELRKIQESMTEEEKLTEKEKAQRGFQRLVERFEREESETRRIVNQKKKEYFAVLVKTGLALAKIVEADFEAESNEECGTMSFRTGLMCIGVPGGPSGRDELVLLMRMADHIEIIPNGNILEWIFSFEFCDTFISGHGAAEFFL